MIDVITEDTWSRKGISLLWDIESLSGLANINTIYSLREFLNCYEKEEWPEEFLTLNGESMIVVGLEDLINMMEPTEMQDWLEKYLYPSLLSFQSEYEGQCSLIFWMPNIKNRLMYDMSTKIYYLQYRGKNVKEKLPLSLCLWNGAAKDAKLIGKDKTVNNLGDKGCMGLYHPRIS